MKDGYRILEIAKKIRDFETGKTLVFYQVLLYVVKQENF